MKCERCGGVVPPYDASEEYYNGQAGSYYGGHLWILCPACSGHLQEMIEHAAQGGTVQLIGDTGRVWTYAVESGVSVVAAPGEL